MQPLGSASQTKVTRPYTEYTNIVLGQYLTPRMHTVSDQSVSFTAKSFRNVSGSGPVFSIIQ